MRNGVSKHFVDLSNEIRKYRASVDSAMSRYRKDKADAIENLNERKLPIKLEQLKEIARNELYVAYSKLKGDWSGCYPHLVGLSGTVSPGGDAIKGAVGLAFCAMQKPCLQAIRFILGTGIRASELCGLRWCDVSDEGANISQIVYMVNNRALSEEEKKMERVKEAPKTSAGRRFIPFSDGTLPAILEEQKKQQRIERMKAGSCWIGGDPGRGEQYVFATKNGAPADRYNLGRTLRNCFDNAGLKRRGLHALRHTFATLWIQAGQDVRTLSEILGHTSVSFTMQRYVHSDTATKKRGMAVMASYLAE